MRCAPGAVVFSGYWRQPDVPLKRARFPDVHEEELEADCGLSRPSHSGSARRGDAGACRDAGQSGQARFQGSSGG